MTMSRKYITTGMNKSIRSMHKIINITEGSIAEELEICPGSKLISINGEEVRDIFDYRFLIADDHLEMEIENPQGELDIYEIEKDFDEEMGLEFESGLMDDYKSCCNRCIFCFIDQMPEGMRETLYFKDDDSRLSFLQGNYITLTNMKDEDVDRIIRYRMSPINISIHSTDKELRCKMLNNKRAGEVLKYLDRFFEAGIKMNGQIVLCKGINDAEELKRTIEDLYKYAPLMESVSVVPVGLTKYREGLYPLEAFDSDDAAEVIAIIEDYQKKYFEEKGLHFIHASDEFYISAGREIPEEERYDGYLQLENGVGMLRLFENEFYEALEEMCSRPQPGSADELQHPAGQKIMLASGKLAYPFIKDLIRTAEERLKKADLLPEDFEVKCYEITNNFFGPSVTVSGLVCGQDIIDQLSSETAFRNEKAGEEERILLLPVNMMRSGEKYFLDDVTVEDVEKALNTAVKIVPNDGAALLLAMLGQDIEIGNRQIYEIMDE